jgi:hypothetical protein
MWLKRLQKFQKENKQILDFKFDLHLSLYIQELIDERILFQIDMKNNSLEIIMLEMSGEVDVKEKEISKEEFYYWWQITKFNEIFEEEQEIFTKFNEKKEKINKVVSKIKDPEINDKDSEEEINKKHNKIQENKEKIMKLNLHLKSEADNSNEKINSLKNFRTIYPTIESLDRFFKNITILLNSG